MRVFEPVIKSLGRTLGFYWLFQNLFYGAMHFFFLGPTKPPWYFYPSTALYHVFFFYIISSMKSYMVYTETKKTMEKMNFSNRLTLFRLSSLPTVAFLFVWSQHVKNGLLYPLVIFTAVVFLTDLLDGYFARKSNQVTNIGKLLDSGSDYLVLFILTLILWTFNLFPPWLFITILLRMAFQILGVIFASFFQRDRKVGTTFLGKASFFGLMVYYGLLLLSFGIEGMIKEFWFSLVQMALGILLWLSIADKFIYFWSPKKRDQFSSSDQK